MKNSKKRITKEKDIVKTYESKVKLLEALPSWAGIPRNLYFVYFEKLSMIAVFKVNLEDKKALELPIKIIQLGEIKTLSFRIANAPEKLVLYLKEDDDKMLIFSFANSSFKDIVANDIIKKLKIDSNPKISSYPIVELQYKLTKIIEKNHFDLFKDNYDHHKYLKFNHLSAFSGLYNANTPVRKYMFNRLFLGNASIVSIKSKLIRCKLQIL